MLKNLFYTSKCVYLVCILSDLSWYLVTDKIKIKMGDLDSKPQSGKTYLSLTIFFNIIVN